jgi:hypothetical protein
VNFSRMKGSRDIGDHPQHPLQGDKGCEDYCDNSDKDNGAVEVPAAHFPFLIESASAFVSGPLPITKVFTTKSVPTIVRMVATIITRTNSTISLLLNSLLLARGGLVIFV